MNFKNYSQALVLLIGSLFLAQPALAAMQCKSSISQKGMFYFDQKTAISSARGRWEKRAAQKHGIGYSFWSKAKSRSTKCSFTMKNGKKLWNCKLTAKPCKKLAPVCKPKLVKKGMFYTNKSKAKSSAKGRWEKQAAISHGVKFSFWKKAKTKIFACKSQKKGGQKVWNCHAIARPCN